MVFFFVFVFIIILQRFIFWFLCQVDTRSMLFVLCGSVKDYELKQQQHLQLQLQQNPKKIKKFHAASALITKKSKENQTENWKHSNNKNNQHVANDMLHATNGNESFTINFIFFCFCLSFLHYVWNFKLHTNKNKLKTAIQLTTTSSFANESDL